MSQVGDKREEDEKRDDYFSLQKRTFALFFRSRIVLFFALPL